MTGRMEENIPCYDTTTNTVDDKTIQTVMRANDGHIRY